MYNCLYDCSYCFLQGLYSSADYVVFVNYEDFLEDIIQKSKENPSSAKTFFLAMTVTPWLSIKLRVSLSIFAQNKEN